MNPKTKDQGYLTFAQGKQYLQCAYLLALSVKTYCDINDFTVVTDCEVPEYMLATFDQVVNLDTLPVFANECLAWTLTPYRETFKVESDMLITSNIDHWWAGCRLRDVTFTTQVCNYRGQVVNDTKYRKMWNKQREHREKHRNRVEESVEHVQKMF